MRVRFHMSPKAHDTIDLALFDNFVVSCSGDGNQPINTIRQKLLPREADLDTYLS